MSECQREIHDALRREAWSLKGGNAVVKVKSLAAKSEPSQGGYITLAKYLYRKTPGQIVADLGLKKKDFETGTRIYRFLRLPQASEYEYRLTADFPDGVAYDAVFSDPEYPPGSRTVHQWEILKAARIKVDSKDFIDLKPGQVFPSNWPS